MRVLPVVIAALVVGVLYLFVMERDLLLGITNRDQTTIATSPEDAASPAAKQSLPAAADETATRRVSVLARESEAQSINNAVLLRGRTEASRSVEVRAETSGRIVSQPLPRGAEVNEGDVLCSIDEGTRRAALADAQARLADAELNARNAERLTEGGFAAETRASAARAALQSAQAGVDAARTELQRIEIRAPFSGLLETDTAETGSLAQPGSLCATILQLDPIRLIGFAAEADVERLEVNAMAGGRLASGQDLTGSVSFIARSADLQTRTFRVEVTVANPTGAIRDGQTVDILIATEGVSAHLIPGSAMTLDDSGSIGVRVVSVEGTAEFMPLRVLRDTAEGIWVTGLPDSVTLIVRGQEFVIDGTPLDVSLAEPAI